MAFQSNAFQNDAFQVGVVASRIKRREDYREVFLTNERDELDKKQRQRRRLEILAEEAFQRKLEQLRQDELDFLDLVAVMLAEES